GRGRGRVAARRAWPAPGAALGQAEPAAAAARDADLQPPRTRSIAHAEAHAVAFRREHELARLEARAAVEPQPVEGLAAPRRREWDPRERDERAGVAARRERPFVARQPPAFERRN